MAKANQAFESDKKLTDKLEAGTEKYHADREARGKKSRRQ
jgi:hypothetical protein